MGVALAEVAHRTGWLTTLLLGPAAVKPPAGIEALRFESTADLQALLDAQFPLCDVLIMAAAVADYRPIRRAEAKLRRTPERMTIELEPTPDLVAACATRKQPHQRIIAFALEESADLESRAIEKLHRKGVDAIVANPLETMGAADIAAVVYTPDGRKHLPPHDPGQPLNKTHFARWLIEWIETL